MLRSAGTLRRRLALLPAVLHSAVGSPALRGRPSSTTESCPPLRLSARCCSTGNSQSRSAPAAAAAASTTSSNTSRLPKRKTQIAIVGSGPSGCFVASQLTRKHPTLHVDIFERLPVPFGLCRYGVAPDHPDVKNVEKQFLDLFKSGRVTWVGNVTVGKEIPVQALLSHYAAVVFATGAEGSKKLNIPGEDLSGVISARSFVEYYNTFPFPYGSPRFCPFDVERTQRAIVIGNGNVAMDVVRVLGGSYKYFCPTDMNAVCLKALMKNKIDQVSIIARRGVEHSAFATAEFRELTKYQEGHVKVEVDAFALEEAIKAMPGGRTMRAHKRMMELVHQYAVPESDMQAEAARLVTDAEGVPLPSAAAAQAQTSTTAATSTLTKASADPKDARGPCALRFRYNLTPIAILPSSRRKNCVGGVLFQKTEASSKSEGSTTDASSAAYCVIPCDLVMTSIGYRGDAVADVPFDHKAGVISNMQGRVKGMPRVYCSGWVKNGAKGVILHSVVDAHETVASILADMEKGIIPTEATKDEEDSAAEQPQPSSTSPGNEGQPLLVVESVSPEKRSKGTGAHTTMLGKYGLVDYFVEKKLQPVSMAGLERIFYVEHQRGVDLGKRAEKIDTVRDMLDVALGGDVGRKADERVRRITPARSDAMMYLKELLDDDTDLREFAQDLAKDMPHRLAQQHPLGRISPSQL